MARVVKARQYLCLDADVLVVSSLATLFEQHAALPKGRVLIAPEATRSPVTNLGSALQSVYLATPQEVERLVDSRSEIAADSHVINDGVFVADPEGLSTADEFLRRSPSIREWVEARHDVWWRHKAAFNIALASARATEPLDGSFNAQLHVDPAEWDCGREGVRWRGNPARVLHFNGSGRRGHAAWKSRLLGRVA
jgi:hypothetical protein